MARGREGQLRIAEDGGWWMAIHEAGWQSRFRNDPPTVWTREADGQHHLVKYERPRHGHPDGWFLRTAGEDRATKLPLPTDAMAHAKALEKANEILYERQLERERYHLEPQGIER